MQQGFVDVNNVPTKVITWGKWVEDKFEPDGPKDLIICIPGNPGVTRFYTVFLQTIYEKVGFPIWIVGHAGHEVPSPNKGIKLPELKGNEHLYGLQGQIDHKVNFIEKYVPKDARVHFIGHSIGSYIILRLLRDLSIKNRAVQNYCLFPTIEYMAETPNGKFLLSLMPHVINLTIFMSWIFSLLPSAVQAFLLYIYLQVTCNPKLHMKTLQTFIDPFILKNVFFMAKEEMDDIKERDDEVIRGNKGKLRFYYGATDGWTPPGYCEKLAEDHRDLKAEVCVRGFDHAFVLKNSRQAKFIEKYVPDDVRIHFIGHSLGTYMILQLHKELAVQKRLAKSYLLFPSIEHPGKSEMGRWIITYMPTLFRWIVFMMRIFCTLPLVLQSSMVYVYLKLMGTPVMHVESYQAFINPIVFTNFCHVGKEDLEVVGKRDDELIRNNKHRLKFYFGVNDSWVPLSYYENLKKDHPDLDVELCRENYEHAFVLKSSLPVGDMVAAWINKSALK